MQVKHNFVHLAEVQREQGTLYCAGLDVHPFGSLAKNIAVYNQALNPQEKDYCREVTQDYYASLLSALSVPGMEVRKDFSFLLASIEGYLIKVIDILVRKCNIRTSKPQWAFYEQFGPAGIFLLSRIRQHITELEITEGVQLITIGDVKRGDIDTTQAAYFIGLLGNLKEFWGIDYAPFNFDIINVSPWMGSDVMCFGKQGKPGLGLNLMRGGKGIIVVNKTSNPSGPEYQDISGNRLPENPDHVMSHNLKHSVQMWNVSDMSAASREHELDHDGLSSIGLVVGSTRACDGSVRLAFPTTTLLVPGFGAQDGKFSLIMPELIREGKWNGQGALFSSSRGTMYPWMEKFGGSGQPQNLEDDLCVAIEKFRANEKEAYGTAAVRELGIEYPFN